MQDDTAALVRRAAAGDQGAWDGIVDRYSGLLWSITRSYRLGEADAADVLQTAWMRLLENLQRIENPDRLGSWLATVVRHEIHRMHRRGGRWVPTDNDSVLDAAAPSAPGPEVIVLVADRDRRLWWAFAQLSDRCQRLLRMLVTGTGAQDAEHAGERYSYRDAALALGIAMGSLGPTRMRCLDELRHALEELGISGEPDDS